MTLQYGGRPVAWLGLGTPADDVAAGITALQNAITASAATPGAAVAALQTAGNTAVTSLGPAIDKLSGGDPNVMNLTQQAWQQNGALAVIDSSSAATQSVADSAKAIASQMVQYYQQAAKAAAKSAAAAPAQSPAQQTNARQPKAASPADVPKAPDTPAASSSFTDWVKAHQTPLAVGGAVVAGGAILAAVLSASAPKRAA